MLEIVKQRTIKFSGVLTIIFSLIVWMIAYAAEIANPILIMRLIGLTSGYFILALISEDYRGLGEMFSRIWDINQTDGIADDEKLNLIRNFLEAEVVKWNKYWNLYQSISQQKKIKDYPEFIKSVLKEYTLRIIKGEVNVQQAGWIFAYLAHTLIMSANIFDIPIPIDILVSIGLMFIILFASGSIVGFGKFMTEFFKAVVGESEKQIKAILKLTEDLIITGSKSYYFITIKREQKLKKEQLNELEKINTIKDRLTINGD